MKLSIHRNLNAMKTRPDVFIYSIKNVTGNIGLGKLIRHTSDTETVWMINPIPVCQHGGLKKIAEKDERSVSAWVVGDVVTQPIPGTLREITINPLSAKRGGRSELQYVWDDNHAPVQWSLVKAVKFAPDGTFAVLA